MLRRKRDRRAAKKDSEMAVDVSLSRRRETPRSRKKEPPISVVITGHTKASEDDLINFVWRKAKVRLLNVTYSPASVTAVVKAVEFPRLNSLNGVAFAGDCLAIRRTDGGTGDTSSTARRNREKRKRKAAAHAKKADATLGLSSSANETIQNLKRFLEQRYNAEAKMLDLSAMHEDQFLRQMGILAEASTKSKMFPALMKVASMYFKDVQSVNLTKNNITSVTPITTLAQTWPKLLNLCLSDNNITTLADLDPWAGKSKLACLQELVLLGNPIVTVTFAGKPEAYMTEIVTRFPNLKMLDGAVVPPNLMAAKHQLAFPTHSGFFDSEETQKLVLSFLGAFFNGWDGDRKTTIQQMYSPTARFSVSVNSSVPRSSRQNASHANTEMGQRWSSYKRRSRNLMYVKSAPEQTLRLSQGQDDILKTVTALPETKHDMSDASQWLIESWNITLPSCGPAIKIIVHGRFEEPKNKHLARSFDRFLLILPGGPTGVQVINDMLVLRPYVGPGAWQNTLPQPTQPVVVQPAQPAPVAPVPVTASGTPVAPATPAQVLPVEQQQQMQLQIQRELVARVKAETGLNDVFAEMCCQQNNWDYNRAIAAFTELKQRGVIPPEAFR
ncbi:mRNA export receptor [Schizosaccharomyces japonicus yFS275]|uniref:mRNA export factor MEX67 n=1 Tax=Schizosaccharomyces japonicus (strain yFS275 / FY16936) TaxID=402676 RepID=B6JXN8_SCHJY|nr:mRNA export receptor [Schizosaccharomyces japonicus yFS275]EEB05182.1 mRNA export receptor [Schizosaccharomyces japonicus yFS275]